MDCSAVQSNWLYPLERNSAKKVSPNLVNVVFRLLLQLFSVSMSRNIDGKTTLMYYTMWPDTLLVKIDAYKSTVPFIYPFAIQQLAYIGYENAKG